MPEVLGSAGWLSRAKQAGEEANRTDRGGRHSPENVGFVHTRYALYVFRENAAMTKSSKR